MKRVKQRKIIIPVLLLLSVCLLLLTQDKKYRTKEPEKVTVYVLDEFLAEPEEKAEQKPEDKKPESRMFTLCNVPFGDEYQKWLYELCLTHEVDYSIMIALAEKESNFNKTAVSPTNDYGMWQINKKNHEWLEEALGRKLDLFDPYDNAEAAVYILSINIKAYGDIQKALMAYNMGPTGAKFLWREGITTSRYADSVCAKAFWYKNNNFIARTGG